MKVLAVDPGYDRMGLAVIENSGEKDVLLMSACVQTDKKDEPSVRLKTIGLHLEEAIVHHKPDIIALEGLFFSKNQKTALQVAEARGVVIYLAGKFSCSLKEFSPNTVKLAVTGYGGSNKKAVTAMLHRLLDGVPDKALDDEYDAIAVGLTAMHYQYTHHD